LGTPSRCPRSARTSARDRTTGRWRALRAHETAELARRLPEHAAVEEHERIQRLVLRRRRHAGFRREVAQERRDLRRPERDRMALAMEEDEASHPMDVRTLGTLAVVA
jgi:hypothetical protein